MDSDEDDNDNYVLYGSALDPIEEDDVPRKKPLTLEEQVVVDKQGRRRFHGAFTGGFSAGFFNTVGTLEGWKPSVFKSSRSERGGNITQKPEDFMDEEDMDEFGIAPKVIKTTSEYRDQQTRKRVRCERADGPIPGEPVLHSLLQPVRDTIGARLLKKMGWKPGQGVGPRVTKLEKKQSLKEQKKLKEKVYGCSLPEGLGNSSTAGQEESSDEEDDDYGEVLYAPDDITPFKCMPKDDLFGIGYSGLDRRPILCGGKSVTQRKSILNITENKKKISISGQAFGVGAFEEEDEDIYSMEDMSHYDFSLEAHCEKKVKVKHTRWNQENDANYAGRPLEGFVLAKTRIKIQCYPPPELPPAFQPLHQNHQSRFEPAVNVDETLKGDGRRKGFRRHDLTAADREVILSGTQRKADSSVAAQQVNEIKIKVEPVSQKDSTEECIATTPSSAANEPVISKDKAQFRPFAANPDKQHRYEQYLGLLKFNQKSKLSELQPLSMTEWERDRERIEFEQASKLYKPLSGLMFDRFVSAIHPDIGDEGSSATITFAKEEESEKKKAAKMKMYGRLTREITTWTPCSLLYKRFNIPDPGVSVEPEVKRKSSKFSVFDFMASSSHNSVTSSATETPSSEIEKIPAVEEKTTPSENVSEVPVQSLQQLTKVSEETSEALKDDFPANKIDLFKAIFLSSSDSESEGEAATPENEDTEVGAKSDKSESKGVEENVPTASQLNVERNTSPPRGVFANLDLDAINQRLKSQKDSESNKILQKNECDITPKLIDVDPDSGTYGPRLPDKSETNAHLTVRTISKPEKITTDSSSSEEVEWVEISSQKSKKSKHHKSHRKKSKKHKSKHKHKK